MEQCISPIFNLGRREINPAAISNLIDIANVNISFKLSYITNKVKRN